MRKKCKLCESPLDHSICEYCGTVNEIASPPEPEPVKTVDLKTHHLSEEIEETTVETAQPTESHIKETLNPSTPTDDVSPLQHPLTTGQPEPTLYTKKANPLIHISYVILVLAVISGGVWLLHSNRSPSDPSVPSHLLGNWSAGQGSMPIAVFGEAHALEFLENGTVIVTEGGSRWPIDWEFSTSSSGYFNAAGQRFDYTIEGDTLTLTDSRHHQWTFQQTPFAETAMITETDRLSPSDLSGTWEWDFDDDFIYVFNVDGTGVRGFSELRFDFLWELVDGHIIYLHFGSGRHAQTERWAVTLEPDQLTLADLDGYHIWQYSNTQNPFDTTQPFTDSPLLGRWDNGQGPFFLWVFEESDTVEFFENGTVIRTQGDISETLIWRPGATGHFSADGLAFTYFIQDGQLIITDIDDDSWFFQRQTDNP
ncbi:MAG: hypothetical protein FWG67_04230 [Defluviitaleaceae bacterium]|nr:hypothetical protein [Defluviitaleaceae bacterium]